MGMAYAMQGNDTQALQSYEKYLRLAPKAPDANEIRQSIGELKARAKQRANMP
jgi:regulator of sirC expression with transglutaminase-like and TPR domain